MQRSSSSSDSSGSDSSGSSSSSYSSPSELDKTEHRQTPDQDTARPTVVEAKEAPATIPPTEANEAAESANDAAAYGAAAHDAAAESAREAAAESAHEAAAKSANNAAAKVTVVKDDKMEKASKKKDVEERKKRKKSRKNGENPSKKASVSPPGFFRASSHPNDVIPPTSSQPSSPIVSPTQSTQSLGSPKSPIDIILPTPPTLTLDIKNVSPTQSLGSPNSPIDISLSPPPTLTLDKKKEDKSFKTVNAKYDQIKKNQENRIPPLLQFPQVPPRERKRITGPSAVQPSRNQQVGSPSLQLPAHQVLRSPPPPPGDILPPNVQVQAPPYQQVGPPSLHQLLRFPPPPPGDMTEPSRRISLVPAGADLLMLRGAPVGVPHLMVEFRGLSPENW